MAWRTVRFHTGDRVVRLKYDPENPMSAEPTVGEVTKRRGILGDILVIAAGGFLAMNAIRWLGKRDAAKAAEDPD